MTISSACAMNYIQEQAKKKDWSTFIKINHESGNLRTLYLEVMRKYFSDANKAKYRAVNFGSGSAKEDLDLLKNGWEVLSVDSCDLTHEILSKEAKKLSGTSISFEGNFEDAKLEGQYDLIMSFNSLPFGKKDKLDLILKNLSQHLKNDNGIFVANFFGKKHGFTRQKTAFATTKKELYKKYLENGLEIIEFEEVIIKNYKTQSGDTVTWHDFKVIAKKKHF